MKFIFIIFQFVFIHLQLKIIKQWRLRQNDEASRLNGIQSARKIKEKQIERKWRSAKRFLHSKKGAFSNEWVQILHFRFLICSSFTCKGHYLVFYDFTTNLFIADAIEWIWSHCSSEINFWLVSSQVFYIIL